MDELLTDPSAEERLQVIRELVGRHMMDVQTRHDTIGRYALESLPGRPRTPRSSAPSPAAYILFDGAKHVKWLLESSPVNLSEELGMRRECFKLLEQLAFLLEMVRSGLSVRKIASRYQHFKSTVSQTPLTDCIRVWPLPIVIHLNKCIRAIVDSPPYDIYVYLPKPGESPGEMLTNNVKYANHFVDCVDAIGGTHGPWKAKACNDRSFRSRNSFVPQNVLAMCSFDLRFQYVLTAEGSAHNLRVLAWALDSGLVFHAGKYYLGDAGYAMSDSIMVPYRGVRYPLRQWIAGGRDRRWASKSIFATSRRPETPEELFNLRHASLRNAVERIFGVVQRKFKLLTIKPEWSNETQADFPLLCAFLHNFVLIHEGYNWASGKNRSGESVKAQLARLQNIADRAKKVLAGGLEPVIPSERDLPAQARVTGRATAAKRDEIAKRMWDDYVVHKSGLTERYHADALLDAFEVPGDDTEEQREIPQDSDSE